MINHEISGTIQLFIMDFGKRMIYYSETQFEIKFCMRNVTEGLQNVEMSHLQRVGDPLRQLSKVNFALAENTNQHMNVVIY